MSDHRTVRGHPVSLSVTELSGAVGDAVTVLPIAVGVAALSELRLGPILLGFAVFQAVWGLHYSLPVSVEPMKALAALVIAGSLTTGEFVAAGLLAGAAANLVLGGLYAAVAVGAVGLVARFPMAVLGVVLALVALQIGRTALDTDDLALTVAVGLVGLVVDVGVAFVLGSVVALVLGRAE